jgi:hypothetical protein
MSGPEYDPKLEQRCDACYGRGIVSFPSIRKCAKDGYEMLRCSECKGSGIVTTEFGEEVLDFIRRHIEIGVNQ